MKKKQIFILLVFLSIFFVSSEVFANTSKISVTIEIPDQETITVEVIESIGLVLNDSQQITIYIDNETILYNVSLDIDKRNFTINVVGNKQVRAEVLFNDDYNNIVREQISHLNDLFIDFSYFVDEQIVWYSSLYNNLKSFEFEGEYVEALIKLVATEHRPAITGKDTIINNIDNPYTVEQIKSLANLKAYDDYDKDITSQIETEIDLYTENNTTLGTFKITFKVMNTAKLITRYELNVKNMDFTKPVITGPKNLTITYKDDFDIENIKKDIKVTDNSNEVLALIDVDSNYIQKKPGTYTFNFEAKDSSGNISKHNFILTVEDKTKPEISDNAEGIIKLNFKDNITDEVLLAGLTANDEIDGDLTDKIVITDRDNITNIQDTYLITFQVKDKSGNITTFQRTFQVVSYDAPTFWVSKNLVSIEDINQMTLEQLADLFASYEGITLLRFEVIEDNYTNQSKKAGKYNVILKLIDTNNNEYIVAKEINVVTTKKEHKMQNVGIVITVIGLSTIILFSGLIYYVKKKEHQNI